MVDGFPSVLISNPDVFSLNRFMTFEQRYTHWGKADDRNCIHGHPKMSDEKLGQYLYCLFMCFYIIFFTKHTLVRCKCIKESHGNHILLPRNVYETGNWI